MATSTRPTRARRRDGRSAGSATRVQRAESLPGTSVKRSTPPGRSTPRRGAGDARPTRLEPEPEVIVVGYQSVTVEGADLADFGCVGRYFHNKGLIQVEETIPDGAQRASTLLHEVLHAVCYVHGILPDDIEMDDGKLVEELYVNTIANGVIQVMRDNPRFTLYLQQRSALTNQGERVRRGRRR